MSFTTSPIDVIGIQSPEPVSLAKPKILVVDDEPDNLDLLYRTFRRDFRVLRAGSGAEALNILAQEGEVAVIISDQRMPEMKGTEFLSKTVPRFPHTMRIILTGFTDVEDLVEAINTGQVYKYITKPWDPFELRNVVARANETYQLLKRREEDIHRAQLQTTLLKVIVDQVKRDNDIPQMLEHLATSFGEGFSTTACVIHQVQNGRLIPQKGLYHRTELVPYPDLTDDPLTHRAIATRSVQLCTDASQDDELSHHSYYQQTWIKSHLVIPLQDQHEVFAVMSLQWDEQFDKINIHDEDIALLNLLTHQVELSMRYVVQP